MIVLLATLLERFKSSSLDVTLTILINVPFVVSLTVIVKVALDSCSNNGMLHMLLANVPLEVTAFKTMNELGSISFTLTLCASVPSELIFMVYVAVSPTK